MRSFQIRGSLSKLDKLTDQNVKMVIGEHKNQNFKKRNDIKSQNTINLKQIKN